MSFASQPPNLLLTCQRSFIPKHSYTVPTECNAVHMIGALKYIHFLIIHMLTSPIISSLKSITFSNKRYWCVNKPNNRPICITRLKYTHRLFPFFSLPTPLPPFFYSAVMITILLRSNLCLFCTVLWRRGAFYRSEPVLKMSCQPYWKKYYGKLFVSFSLRQHVQL